MQRLLDYISSTSIINKQLDVKKKDDVDSIQYKQIKFYKELDYGSAAKIFIGDFDHQIVAIKKYIMDAKKDLAWTQLKLEKEWNVLKATFPSQYIVKSIAYCMQPPLIVMEYLPNGALDSCLMRMKFTWEQKLIIANDIVLGMIELLKQGIYHRDIKSANILITNDLRAKLNDFDVTSKDKFVFNEPLVGSLSHIAPEYFINNKSIDLEKADIYSFGVVLLELAVARNYFEAYINIANKMSDKVNGSLIRINMLENMVHNCLRHWPLGYKDIILDCIRIDPAKRPTIYQVQERLIALSKTLNEKSEEIDPGMPAAHLLYEAASRKY